jgi:hypothetical protein
MAKSIFRLAFFILICTYSNASMTAHRLHAATKILTGGGFVSAGLVACAYNKFLINKPIENEPMPEEVQQFIRNIMRKCGSPNADTLPLVISETLEGFSWHSLRGKAIGAPLANINELELALKQNDEASEAHKKFVSMVIKHELCHNMENDSNKTAYSLALIPIVTQSFCTLTSSAINKLFGWRPPQTYTSCFFRSTLNVAMLAPKVAVALVGYFWYLQSREWAADEFACKNAWSRTELDEYQNRFIMNHDALVKMMREEGAFNSEEVPPEVEYMGAKIFLLYVDPLHPCYLDRANFIEGFKQKWDEE